MHFSDRIYRILWSDKKIDDAHVKFVMQKSHYYVLRKVQKVLKFARKSEK